MGMGFPMGMGQRIFKVMGVGMEQCRLNGNDQIPTEVAFPWTILGLDNGTD